MTSFAFPDSIRGTLDVSIIKGCSKLDTLVIGSGIDTIPVNTRAYVENLQNLVFRDSPHGLTLMYAYILASDTEKYKYYRIHPFYGCPLRNVYIGRYLGIAVTGYHEESTYCIQKFLESNASTMNKLTVGGYITIIDDYSFRACGLDSIIITGNVTEVVDEAFAENYDVKYLYIGKNVTSIGDDVFESSLTDVVIEDSSTPLSCSSSTFNVGTIQYVYLGRDVDASGCFSGETKITTVVVGDSVTSIAESTFQRCSELTSLTLGSGLKSIENSAFKSCTSLTELNLPNSVETISSSAFYNCTSLATLTIPSQVDSIADYAFYNCPLDTINCWGAPCEIDSTTFSSYSYLNATVYVPNGSLSTYQSADNWCYFWNIVETDNLSNVTNQTFSETKILARDGAIIVEDPTYAVSVYNLWGVLVGRRPANGGNVEIHVPSHGIYIVKVGTQTHKVSL